MWFALALILTAQQPPVAQRAIEALEQRWLAAEHDPVELDEILAEDFIHVLPQGFITKRDQLAFMRAHPAPKDATMRHFEDLRVRVFGAAAVATGIVVATSPDGKDQRTAFTDVFAYRGKRWRAVNAQETPLPAPSR